MRVPVQIPDPDDRLETGVTGPESYPAGVPVWIHRGGNWRRGCLLESSPRAAMVRYRPTDDRGTTVDTVRTAMLLGRTDVDQMDHPLTWRPNQSAQPRERAIARRSAVCDRRSNRY